MVIRSVVSSVIGSVVSPVVGGGSGSGGGGSLSLDAPVTATMAEKTYYAFGLDRQTEYWDAPSVRLKRLSDDEEEDFGFSSSTGRFNLDSVLSWASGADVDKVCYYDQNGADIQFTAFGTVPFIRSGVVKRFGCDYNVETEGLTRSTSSGGMGCNLAGTGYLRLTGTTLPASTDGLSFYMLYSHNTRKVGGSFTDTFGATFVEEDILSYGLSASNRVHVKWSGDLAGDGLAVQARIGGASAADNLHSVDNGNIAIAKQNAQRVLCMSVTDTTIYAGHSYHNMGGTGIGAVPHIALSATNQTNLNDADIDNGDILVGANFVGSSVDTDHLGDFIFGALIVTKATLTPLENFLVISKLTAMGQQHLLSEAESILGLFDEYMLTRDVNPTTGALVGAKGNTTFNFNVGTVTEGTSTFDFDYEDPISGLTGIQNPTSTNMANGWQASNQWFALKKKGTIISFSMVRNFNTANSGDLMYSIAIKKEGEQYTNERENMSMALGFDHQCPNLWVIGAAEIDTNQISGDRFGYPASQAGLPFIDRDYLPFGDDAGGTGANQSKGKYNRNTVLASFDYAAKPISMAFGGAIGTLNQDFTETEWANENPSQTILSDAPTGADIAQNYSFYHRFNVPMVSIGTFSPPSDFNEGAGYAGNTERMLNATNQLMQIAVGGVLGHTIGDVGINNHASIHYPASDARLQSGAFVHSYEGVLYGFFFIEDEVISFENAQKIGVNLYRIFDESVGAEPVAPSFITQPSITGAEIEAGTIRCLRGNAGGVPLARYTYQWFEYASEPADVTVGGTLISGATSVAYVNPTDVPALGANKWRACRVTATNSEGSDVAWTDAVEIIQLVAPVRTADPTLGGFVNEGQSVTITTGTYTGTSPITLLRRHYLDNVIDATGLTFTFSGDTGKSYKWDEVASNPKGSTTFTSASVTVGAVLPYNLISTINSNELRVNFDLRANEAASYSGSGTRFENLETAPYDGSAQAAYDFIMQNYSLIGTAGQNGSYLEAAANGAMVIDAANVAAMPAWARRLHHDSAQTGTLTDWWFAFFGRFINATSGDQYLFGTRKTGTNTIGCNSHYNASELMRVQQANGTTSAQSTPASPAIVTGSDSYIVVSRNGTSNNLKIWYGSATAGLDTTAAFVTASADPDNLLTLCAGSVLSGTARLPLQSGARIDAISGGKQHLTNAMVSSLVTHMNTELGKSYSL